MIAAFDFAYADSLMVPGDVPTSLSNLQGYVDSLNNAMRTQVDCNLVRDRFDCPTAAYNTLPGATREKGSYDPDPTGGFGSWNAGTDAEPMYVSDGTALVASSSYTAYTPSAPMSVIPANDNANHDCWCREDYRVMSSTSDCASGAGTTLRVEMKNCPQTDTGGWNIIWTSNAALCNCTVGSTFAQFNRSCASVLGVPSDRVSGYVTDTVEVTSCAPYGTNIVDTDYAACTCPSNSDSVPNIQNACDPGYENSFTFDGESYTDTEFVRHRRWTCPPVSGDLDTPGEVGYWTNYDHTEPCTCVGDISFRDETCSAPLEGVRRFETTLDCSSGTYVDTGALLQDCTSCQWTKPDSGPPINSNTNPGGSFEGDSCSCGVDTVGICKRSAGVNFLYWNDCQCE
ncbi:MAG: hypothetical protein ACLFR0_04875 [Alphaproteobacteria bacterium]